MTSPNRSSVSGEYLPHSAEGKSIARRFEARVDAHPHAIALTLDNDSLTYRELNERANQLAGYLWTLGVAPDVLVGIHLDRSFNLMVAILAILKAGGAYVPLDLACPEDRLRFQIEDSGVGVVLTEAKLAGRMKNVPGKIVCLDQEIDRLARFSKENPSAIAHPEHLAYVIYTSGSTGQPKGVLVTQENVTRLFDTTEEMFHFHHQDVWTLFHSSAFDFSVWEIFGALLYGGRLVIVPYSVSRSASAFHALLLREQVTVLNQTPSAFRQLIHADASASQRATDLRYIIFGGEALEFQSLRPWFERYNEGKPQCVNMYGITETTVHVTSHPITLDDLEKGGSRVGRPLPDLKVYVVDDKNQLVAPGEIGEMLVGGAGVARGYLNRPELTSERFIANPFGDEAFPVLYRSGDLARQSQDGELEYLGRGDHQVKIRGFRIELHEIESVLARHPSIRECAVIARADDGGAPRLVGYLVPAANAAPTVEDLRVHLTQALPDYMVPAFFVFLPSFPLTLNGKLDRAALPVPEADRSHLAASYSAPQNGLEDTLTRLWKTALRQDTVGTEDNFFDLGGDSLLLTALHQKLQTDLGREIPITDLFQFPTIRRLAEHLATQEGTGSSLEDKIQARVRMQRSVLARGRRTVPSDS
jgi:amino acid adenylation domain-containing protein